MLRPDILNESPFTCYNRKEDPQLTLELMRRTNVLIIDETPSHAVELRDYLLSQRYDVHVATQDMEDGMRLYQATKPEIVIADLYIKGQPRGRDFVRRINQHGQNRIPVIYMINELSESDFEETLLTGPHACLAKPFRPIELRLAIELALERNEEEELPSLQNCTAAPASIFVRQGHSLVRVMYQDIIYVEVEGKYCKLVTDKRTYLIQQSIKKLAASLGPYGFTRIHRNYLINIDRVQELNIQDKLVIIDEKKSIPFSKTFRRELLQRFEVYA